MSKKTNKLVCGDCAWYNWTHARCTLHDGFYYLSTDADARPLDTDASKCPDRIIPVYKKSFSHDA